MGVEFFTKTLFRKKKFQGDDHLKSDFKRCLSVFDVMLISLGHMIGAGIYVLTGEVVKEQAGPGIILSFIFSAFAALLSALSYGEFGARYPRAGSAYTYTYVTLGEIWAFIVGWTIPLEYMIGNAAVARSWSGYLDKMFDNAISNFTLQHVGHLSDGQGFFSEYPDFVAFVLLIIIAVAVSLGSKISANVNSAFVTLNVAVLAFVIVAGFYYADLDNWRGTTSDGASMFLPFGISGVLKGASSCFFAYIGFEALATAGEEAKNPHRTIPIATFGSLGIITVIYVLMGAALSLMVPYYNVDPKAAYAAAFQTKGATIAMYIMSVGALAGMINNLMTGSFALPRGVYAMAHDGLIFEWFAKINPTPLNATIVFTILNAILALVFDLKALIEFLSIGTLIAYSTVSACVVIMRHSAAPSAENPNVMDNGGTLKSWVPFKDFFYDLPRGTSIKSAIAVLVVGFAIIGVVLNLAIYDSLLGILILIVGVSISFLAFVFILGHEQNNLELSYKVPFVPYIPCLGLFINILMMVYLHYLTWIRMAVWLSIGLGIYFIYGIRHSHEARKVAIKDVNGNDSSKL